MSVIPFNHFLLSTGLSVRIVGGFNGDHYSLNVVLMKGGRTADIRDDKLLKSVVGFSRPTDGESPSVDDAIAEFVGVISEQKVWFGDESMNVPKLSVR